MGTNLTTLKMMRIWMGSEVDDIEDDEDMDEK